MSVRVFLLPVPSSLFTLAAQLVVVLRLRTHLVLGCAEHPYVTRVVRGSSPEKKCLERIAYSKPFELKYFTFDV
jgi:hypothetical protein